MENLKNQLRETLSTKEFNGIDFENNEIKTKFMLISSEEIFDTYDEAFIVEIKSLKEFYGENWIVDEGMVNIIEVKMFAGYIL